MRLVVTTSVAIILVVAVVPALVVVVCARLGGCFLDAWVGTAFFVRVLSIFAVHTAGLEILVRALGGALLDVLLVVVASATATKLGGVLASTVVSTMIVVIALRMRPVTPALVGEVAQLMHVLLLQLMTQLTLCFCANLLDLMAL